MGIYIILEKDFVWKADKKEIIAESKIEGDSTRRLLKSETTRAINALVDTMGIEKIDTIINRSKIVLPEKLKALLNFILDDNNPSISFSPNKDSAKLSLAFANIGNDHAKSLKTKLVLCGFKNNKFIYKDYSTFQFINRSFIVPAGEKFNITPPLILGPERDTFYIYLKIDYFNSENKEMPPVNKIFFLHENGVDEPVGRVYDRIQQELLKKGIW